MPSRHPATRQLMPAGGPAWGRFAAAARRRGLGCSLMSGLAWSLVGGSVGGLAGCAESPSEPRVVEPGQTPPADTQTDGAPGVEEAPAPEPPEPAVEPIVVAYASGLESLVEALLPAEFARPVPTAGQAADTGEPPAEALRDGHGVVPVVAEPITQDSLARASLVLTSHPSGPAFEIGEPRAVAGVVASEALVIAATPGTRLRLIDLSSSSRRVHVAASPSAAGVAADAELDDRGLLERLQPRRVEHESSALAAHAAQDDAEGALAIVWQTDAARAGLDVIARADSAQRLLAVQAVDAAGEALRRLLLERASEHGVGLGLSWMLDPADDAPPAGDGLGSDNPQGEDGDADPPAAIEPRSPDPQAPRAPGAGSD